MKKIPSLFIGVVVGAVAICGWSCDTKELPETPPAEPTLAVELVKTTDPNVISTSAVFNIKSTLIESYAYKVEEGENMPEPDPEVLYAEAQEIHKITSSEQKVDIYGLEGGKKYTVHFVFKIEGKTKYMSKSLSTTTPQYDRRINIISADHTEFRVQFNVAEGQHFRYFIYDKKDYDFLSTSYRMSDADWLEGGLLGEGPQTIVYKDGETFYDPISGEDIEMVVKPGKAFIVLFVECDADGMFEYEYIEEEEEEYAYNPAKIGSSIRPDSENYTEKCADQHGTSFISPYAKLNLWTAPAIKGEGEFKIEKKITEQNSHFTITPPQSVKQYGVAIIKKSLYDHNIVPSVGEKGAMHIILTSQTEPTTGVKTFKNLNLLEKDSTYMLVAIGMCDDSWSTQIIYTEEFKAITSTKPEIELLVTQTEAEGGTPYAVRYNVKAPNKDLVNAKYLMNYINEWVKVVGGDISYANYVNQKGIVLTEEEIAKINSSEGLTMDFRTFEDMATRISINSYNVDEKLKNFTVKGRSKPEPAKPKVNSPLLTSLLGDWDVVYKHTLGSSTTVTSKNFVSTIAATAEVSDPAFGPDKQEYKDMFAAYKKQSLDKGATDAEAEKYATDQIATQLTAYNEVNAKFGKKYSDQNRLVLRNFGYSTSAGLRYQSPWNLFCSTSYSSYDCEQMFHDYGTKIFLEFKEVGGEVKLFVETDQKFIAPLSGYAANKFVLAGMTGTQMAAISFPVEIVDQNMLKIKAAVNVDNVEYKFIVSQSSDGGYRLHATAAEDIVLTRTSAPASAPRFFNTATSTNIDVQRASFDFKRTRLTKMIKEKAPIEIEVMTEYRSKITPRKGMLRK